MIKAVRRCELAFCMVYWYFFAFWMAAEWYISSTASVYHDTLKSKGLPLQGASAAASLPMNRLQLTPDGGMSTQHTE